MQLLRLKRLTALRTFCGMVYAARSVAASLALGMLMLTCRHTSVWLQGGTGIA